MEVHDTHEQFEHHWDYEHQNLVEMGLKFCEGEFQADNKLVNLILIFCFTHTSATQGVISIVNDKLEGKVPDFQKQSEKYAYQL
jgi:hypothetical protein